MFILKSTWSVIVTPPFQMLYLQSTLIKLKRNLKLIWFFYFDLYLIFLKFKNSY